jgi:hypothetical protein
VEEENMAVPYGFASRLILAAVAGSLAAGCTSLPGDLEKVRLSYNEVVKTSAEQQLLLNIVRLRYADTPSSLAVSGIAAQYELARSLAIVPFFGVGGDANPRGFVGILPSAQIGSADRPTISLTPLDDQEFTRRLFTPLPVEGILYLAKTTWQIQMVFRLYLENLNWVSNAQSASGPTPSQAPDFADFLRGVSALQVLQDRSLIVFGQEERTEPMGGPLPAGRIDAAAVLGAAKSGYEYRRDDGGATWTLIRKTQQPVMHVHPVAVSSPEMREFTRVFRLKPGQAKYEIKAESLAPFPDTHPPGGVATLDLETRSLLQVLFFVAQGVEVPPAHRAAGIVRVTANQDGSEFDWQRVLRGLLKVKSASGDEPPPSASVAVPYKGHWFYVDATDHDSKSTFSFLLSVSRMELTSRTPAAGPVLTLPVGGR